MVSLEKMEQEIAMLRGENNRLHRLITNAKLVEDIEHIPCPVCFRRIPADKSYADPYRHLLNHLIPKQPEEEKEIL